MLATTTHSLRRGLFTTVLVAAIGLLPSLSLAKETEKKDDAPQKARQREQSQRATRTREAVRRAPGLGTQARRAVTTTPLPNARGQVGRESSLRVPRAQERRAIAPTAAQPRANLDRKSVV